MYTCQLFKQGALQHVQHLNPHMTRLYSAIPGGGGVSRGQENLKHTFVNTLAMIHTQLDVKHAMEES